MHEYYVMLNGETQQLPAKMEIVNLAAKLLTQSQLSHALTHLQVLTLLFHYVMALARYDLEYAVRDRARFLKGLLASAGIGMGEAEKRLDTDSFNRGEEVERDEPEPEEQRRVFTPQQVRALLHQSRGSASEGLEKG